MPLNAPNRELQRHDPLFKDRRRVRQSLGKVLGLQLRPFLGSRADSPDVEPAPHLPPSSLEAGFGPQRLGEGIGLLIVKRLCELLHAGLEVSSEAGKGTVFQVVLPRDYGRAAE